jgi:signal transduction histidine kinase
VITNSAVPLRGPDGALTGVVVVNEDITEQVEAERSLRRFANEQQALFTVTSAATARLDVERLLDSVLETVLPVMEADAGWVTVIGADPAGPPSVFAHRGLPRDFIEAEASAPLETCAACWPLVQGEPSSPVPWKLSKCARIPRPVCVNTGLHSHVSVTLKAGEAVYGILNVGWKSEHETDRVEHDLLEAIARQVGIALQNAQLYRSEQEARRTAETLRAAGMALTGTLELASVESTLLDSLRELIPYDRARVMLREGDETLVVRATVTGGKPPEIVRDPAPSFAIAGDPILSEILASGKGVVIDDIYSNPHFARRVAPGFERSWMGVPLVAGNQVIGLYSLSKVEPGHFNARHLRLAEALAAPAAMAIQNAWLFEQVRKGHEQLQTLSRRLVEVQENERRAIARELHDEAGQALTSMTIGLGLVERSANDPDAVVARTNELKKTAGSILANLHRLASNLRPATLDHVGLVSALRQYVENLDEASGAVMQFEAVGFEDRRLSSAHETALYRIAQEAVTNVLRHAQATRIAVLLERHGANVVLVVEDNGTGFDEREAASRGRLGLIGMRERAEALGGRMVIESAAGKGTTIVVEVPHGHADPDRG